MSLGVVEIRRMWCLEGDLTTSEGDEWTRLSGGRAMRLVGGASELPEVGDGGFCVCLSTFSDVFVMVAALAPFATSKEETRLWPLSTTIEGTDTVAADVQHRSMMRVLVVVCTVVVMERVGSGCTVDTCSACTVRLFIVCE